jgi:hypothetical protein
MDAVETVTLIYTTCGIHHNETNVNTNNAVCNPAGISGPPPRTEWMHANMTDDVLHPHVSINNAIRPHPGISGTPWFTKWVDDIARDRLPSPWYLTGPSEPTKQAKANVEGAVRSSRWISGPPQYKKWVQSLQTNMQDEVPNASYGSDQLDPFSSEEARLENSGRRYPGSLGSPWSPKPEKDKANTAVQSAPNTSARPNPAAQGGSMLSPTQEISLVRHLSL